MPRHMSHAPVLDGLEHQLVAAGELDLDRPARGAGEHQLVGFDVVAARRTVRTNGDEDEVSHRVLGHAAGRSHRERLLERVGVHVVQAADVHSHTSDGPVAGALLDPFDDGFAESQFVHAYISRIFRYRVMSGNDILTSAPTAAPARSMKIKRRMTATPSVQ